MMAIWLKKANGLINTINEKTTIVDWTRSDGNHPYTFKTITNQDTTILNSELSKHKHALFLRKIAKECPDELLLKYILPATPTFVTAFYLVKSKFPPEKYIGWIKNFLPYVAAFNLVVYCDKTTAPILSPIIGTNPRIRLVEKPLEEFYTYKFRDQWIENQERNIYLKQISWELNMLWAEKIHFVKETRDAGYFPGTSHVGWCDIGYFRDRPMRVDWPRNCEKLNDGKIYYALVNNNKAYIRDLMLLINKKNAAGLPASPIPPTQVSIAGGFFVTAAKNIDWWHSAFYGKLELYFANKALVKDDQIVVVDCIFSELSKFALITESEPGHDNWFLFSRYL